jgi:hypothetical protein
MSTMKSHRPALFAVGRPALVVAAALAILAPAPPATAVVVDEFSTDQASLTDPPGGASSVATAGADILALRRDLTVHRLAGAGTVTAGVAAGDLTVTVSDATPDTRGEAVVTWDGDNDPDVLDADGLMPLDLTASGHSAFAITVDSAGAGTEIVLEVYTDAANSSRAALRLPAVAATTVFHLSYAKDFAVRLGGGADFTDVGAIVLTVRGTETGAVLERVATVAPALAASKVDLTLADVPIGATPQTPGTTFKYRVTITNTGGEALAVDLADMIDANTTLDSATVDATPIATDDAYETFGNVGLTVLAGADLYDCDPSNSVGLLSNDCDPDTVDAPPADAAELTVTTAGAVATTLGGTATIAADGSFTYDPPVGLADAVDTFGYTVADDDGNTASATVKVHVGQRIWFVDDAHPGADLGTLDDPFVGVTATNVGGAGGLGDQDEAGDILFFFSGSFDTGAAAGLVLEPGQRLLGQGVGLVVDGQTLVAAGGFPTLENSGGGGGHVLTLSTDNQLRGVSLGARTGNAVEGSGFGTFTVSDTEIVGAGGALNLATGTLNATFSVIGSSNAGGRGINLDAVTGSLTVTGSTTISDSAMQGIRVVDGGSTYSFGNTTLSSTGSGVDLSNSATSTFHFASLAVTTDAGPGLLASNSGTLNIGGASNTIVATGGAAVDLTSTSLGGGATFTTVSSSGSPGKGVHLDTVSGDFVATGGSISSAAGVAFDVNGGSSTITYGGSISNSANRSVEITGRGGGAVTLSGSISDTGAGMGIHVASNTGGSILFSGSSKVLDTGTSPAVTLATNTGATIDFTGGGLDVDTTSGAGFSATGGGIVTVQGAGNTVTSTTGTAVNVTDTTIGAGHVTFESIASTTAGANTTIVLDDTGGGQFMVTGTAGAGSGGTISNKTVDAITLNNTDGLVTLKNMILQDIGDLGGGFHTISNDDAIHGQQVDGGLTLDGMTIRRISDQAVHGATLAGNAATVWNGLTVTNSTFENTNRFHVAGVGDANNEGMIRILGIRGTVVITGSVFQDGGELIDFFVTGGTLSMTATGNDFFRAYKEFTSGATASVGGHCVDVTVQSDGDANVTIGDRGNAALGNDFLNCRLGSLRVIGDAGATGDVDVVVGRNDFTVDDHSSGIGGDFDFPQGGVLLASLGTDTLTFDAVVDGNDFDEITNASGGVGQLTLAMQNGAWQVLVEDNTFDTPGNAPWFVRADSTTSARVLFRNNLGIKGAFCSPDPAAAGGGCNLGAGQLCPGAAGYCGPGLRSLSDVQNGAVLDMTVLGDLFAEHDAGFDPGQTYEARVLNTGGGGTLCLDLQNNQAPDGYSLEEFAGDFNLVGSGTCPVGSPSPSCQTLLGNRGNRGGANVATTNPPFVNVEVGSTIDVVAGACQQPAGGIF